ncbi:MAG: hypothetical protein JNJ59_15615 [Deltaproteobacteria bacterium]|nr:hypothetical protein [Deltaproteobacteria bacterium]
MGRRELGAMAAMAAWAVVGVGAGCDLPRVGRTGATAEVDAVGGDTEATMGTPDGDGDAVEVEPCADAGLWRFPGRPEHVVVAADGDAIVAGAYGSGTVVVRYDSGTCAVVWRAAPGIAVRDLALVGDDVVLIGEGLVRLAADTGATRSVEAIVGDVVAGDGDVVWVGRGQLGTARSSAVVATGELLHVQGGVTTVVRRDVVVTDLVARGDAAWAAIGNDVWRFTRTGGERVGTVAGGALSLVRDDDGALFVTSQAPRLRVERVGDEPWSYEVGAGETGWITRAGPDLVLAGNVSLAATPSETEALEAQVTAGDAYIVRMAPHMPIVWTVEVVGGDGVQTVTGVGGDAWGRQWVIGWAEREVVIGEDALEGEGGFVARRPLGSGW